MKWTTSAQEAFQNATVAVPLRHPVPQAELSLATDASDTYIGGVTQQKSGDHWRPLGFFSRKLTDTESCYSTFDRELLAAHAAIRHFHHFCEGHAFQLWSISAPISLQHQHHLAFISKFNVQMLYVSAWCEKRVANFLSRPPPSHQSHLELLPRWRQFQLTSKL